MKKRLRPIFLTYPAKSEIKSSIKRTIFARFLCARNLSLFFGKKNCYGLRKCLILINFKIKGSTQKTAGHFLCIGAAP